MTSEPQVDDGWDEFDHVAMLEKLKAPFEGRQPTKAEFQEWFEAATDRWTGGEYDDEYAEPFGAFTDRVGVSASSYGGAAGSGTALVFSSGGPIAWAAASLLADEPEAAPAAVAQAQPGLRELRPDPPGHRPARHHPGHLQRARPPRRRTRRADLPLTPRNRIIRSVRHP